jgi:hypothetical protein
VNGEDVYDVAKKAEDWEVGECPFCMEPYTRCDCPEPEVAMAEGVQWEDIQPHECDPAVCCMTCQRHATPHRGCILR